MPLPVNEFCSAYRLIGKGGEKMMWCFFFFQKVNLNKYCKEASAVSKPVWSSPEPQCLPWYLAFAKALQFKNKQNTCITCLYILVLTFVNNCVFSETASPPKRLLVQQCTAYVNGCASEFLKVLLEKIKLSMEYSLFF